MNPDMRDPRVDPKLAVDLGDEHDKAKREAEREALEKRQREIDEALAWAKRMRRGIGQRDRYGVFLRAEMRRREREGA